MANYSDIKGFTIQTLSSDTIASQQAGGSWASGTAMNTARDYVAGWGESSDAGLIAGGSTNATELYNGTSWTEKNDMSAPGNPMYARHPVGTTTAALAAGGGSPYQSTVEQWDGTNWTEVGDLVTATSFGSNSPVGTTTAGLIAGGLLSGGAFSAINQTWNGSSWSDANELNEGRAYCAGLGTSTAALEVGGQPSGPTFGNKVEQWDGSSWTEISEINTSRARGTAGGTTTSALFYAGTVGPSSTATAVTEFWNGSSWTEIADLSTARTRGGGGGSLASAILAGGRPPPAVTGATEEWSAPATFNQQVQGQLFFNSTANAFKETITDIPGGTWASGNSLNTARDNTTGTGHSQDAALVMAGRGPSSNIGNCEQYNGTSWTEVADVTARRTAAGSGTSTAALCFGGTTGYPSAGPGQSALTESFNGSTWTEVGDLNSARWRISGSPSGTQTAALCAGGREPPYSAQTEIYDGSTWTEVGDLNAARAGATSIGTSTANIFAGGETAPGPDTANTESWDGTSWTEVNNLPAAAKENGGTGGTSTLGFLAGVGGGAAPTSECDFWNGTSWSEMAELGTGRPAGAGAGTSIGAVIAGGNPFTGATEEFTAPLANKTITAS